MTVTIHQRVHLYLWHWKTGPGWVRSPDLKTSRQSGARVLKVQLQDDGKVNQDGSPAPEWKPIPREIVAMWQSLGFKVWGMMRPSGDPLGGSIWDPKDAAHWAAQQKRDLLLEGFDFNFEDEVMRKDNETGGSWSEMFMAEFRSLCPTLPCHLDTYWGPAGGGINLGAYVNRDVRLSVQTFWGSEGLYDDPVPNIVAKAAGAQPVIPKARVKPIIRVAKNNSGQLPDFAHVFADCKTAGTKGLGLYYIDACDQTKLNSLIRQAISSGASF